MHRSSLDRRDKESDKVAFQSHSQNHGDVMEADWIDSKRTQQVQANWVTCVQGPRKFAGRRQLGCSLVGRVVASPGVCEALGIKETGQGGTRCVHIRR